MLMIKWKLTSFKGESNLSFVWCMLKELGLDVPSVTKVKNFPLPGFKSPQRVSIVIIIRTVHVSVAFTYSTSIAMEFHST